ncbi:MAG: hypothetical protein J5786_04955 [Clostridiales bacterium]|nr:hypothetical protein [Clostridiales bacterium]
MEYKYLGKDLTFETLRDMKPEERVELCSELRDKILKTVSENGGHLASNLGAVELTVALLSVFDYKTDKIVFDVGHQAYSYKLLTGRFDRFNTLRQKDGISDSRESPSLLTMPSIQDTARHPYQLPWVSPGQET